MIDRAEHEAEVVGRYRRLVAEADAWFARALAAHRAEAQCGRGCDGCCRGLFDVTPLDAALLRAGLAAAPAATRAAILAAARAALDAVRAAAPDWAPPHRLGDLGIPRFDALCETLDQIPCPCLAPDGACRLYEHRPLVCRLHGLPMWDPGEEAFVGGDCPRNLPPAGLEEKPALHFDHASFEARELRLMAELAGPEAASDPEACGTIIAAALLAE